MADGHGWRSLTTIAASSARELHAELGEDVLQMGLHGGPTHQQALRDLRVGLPLGDELGDLQLGRREALPPVARTLTASTGPGRVGRRLVPLERILLAAGRSPSAASGCRPSRLDDLPLEAEAPSVAGLVAQSVGGSEQSEAVRPVLAARRIHGETLQCVDGDRTQPLLAGKPERLVPAVVVATDRTLDDGEDRLAEGRRRRLGAHDDERSVRLPGVDRFTADEPQ